MYQHCWEGTCDGLASRLGQSVQLHPNKLLALNETRFKHCLHGYLKHTVWGWLYLVLPYSAMQPNWPTGSDVCVFGRPHLYLTIVVVSLIKEHGVSAAGLEQAWGWQEHRTNGTPAVTMDQATKLIRIPRIHRLCANKVWHARSIMWELTANHVLQNNS